MNTMNFDTDSNEGDLDNDKQQRKHSSKIKILKRGDIKNMEKDKNNYNNNDKKVRINEKANEKQEQERNLKKNKESDLDIFEGIPIDDDKFEELPYPILPDNFKRVPFIRTKERYGPFKLDLIQLTDKFNQNKNTGNFKRYLRKYNNSDSLILRYLTNTNRPIINETGIDLDKIAQSNFIKHKNSSNNQNNNNSNNSNNNNPNKIKIDNFLKTILSNFSDRDMDDVELEGYSEQILGFKNTLNKTNKFNDNINDNYLEDTFKKMISNKRLRNNSNNSNNSNERVFNNKNNDNYYSNNMNKSPINNMKNPNNLEVYSNSNNKNSNKLHRSQKDKYNSDSSYNNTNVSIF